MTLISHYGHKDKPPVEHEISPTLKAQSHGHEPMVKAVLTPDRLEKRQNGRRFKDNEQPSFTLTSQDKHGVMISNVPDFIPKPSDVNNCVRSSGHGSLTAKHNHDHVYDGVKIRRLTPMECERLQGFPDGWTSKGIMDGEEVEISDTQRYKTLGNAVTVNVIESIIKRIF